MILNRMNKASSVKKRNLVTYSNPESLISEQFRTIRTNIQFLTENRDQRLFLLTSPGKKEGKSTSIANLAVSMAQQKLKVLLIDADLRDSYLHTIFKTTNDIGLTDILTGHANLEESIFRTGMGSLDILTSGTSSPNPSEFLGSNNMSELLKKVGDLYNIVLIDSPSVLLSTETRVLANQCDGVILILNHGKTDFKKAAEAKKVLDLAHANVVGAIMNKKR
ncbi:CpsD/CapB family tyrosine-protein kinase [Halobacillus amylolyticus]|uniref:non-specific protein-tyrosine kinase n=1 Tax=Halobacillus amylolyticus TaxID=2932259 RepID=A0ABY4HJX6_9BACI|nr:CpsD/CapB family tyrosine-protein kinase [Halobacillus amylolyticus]UOR13805.1 CpsD/CapB family tyrosine-protein kinase [Halobacillus amylolyticus]